MSYDSEVTTDAPVGWWKLDETSGTTATNSGSVGSAINGTYTGTYTLGATSLLPAKPSGKSLQLTGSGYVAIPYNAGINFNGSAYSTESWFRFSVMSQMSVFSRENNFRQYVTSGKAGAVFWGSGANTAVNFSNDDIDDDVGHHVVAVYSNPDYRLYVDGLLQSQVWDNLTTINNDTSTAMRIGQISSGSLQFAGYIDEVALYSAALSAARIAAHYTAGAAKITFLNQQWQLLAADEMVLSSSGAIVGTMTASGRTIMALLDSGNVSVDLIPILRQIVTLSASANCVSVLGVNQKLQVAFLDTASITQQMVASRFLSMVLANTASFLDGVSINSISGMSLSDIVTASVIIRAGDQEMVGWIINPNLAASVAIENFNFVAFGKHAGKYYGLKNGGLYRLGTKKDGTDNIESMISLGNRNLGTAKMKRVPYAYIGAASNGDLVLRVIVRGSEYLYRARNHSVEMAEQRVDIGRGLKANYWNFELMNREGEDFDIDTIKFMPIVLERRI